MLTPLFGYKIGMYDWPLCQCGEVGDLNNLFFGCTDNKNNVDSLMVKLRTMKMCFPISIYTLPEVPSINIIMLLYAFLKSSKIKF